MMKSKLCTLLILFSCILKLRSQTFELHQVKQIPGIDEKNMRNIAFAVWSAYEEVLASPEVFSTAAAMRETVSSFYDTDFEGLHARLQTLKGNRYTCVSSADLVQNNRLLFNLRFDANGQLVVPDTIRFVSHRLEEKDGKKFFLMPFAFEVKLNDSIKAAMEEIVLEHVALRRVDSLSDELVPVAVKVPFILHVNTLHSEFWGSLKVTDSKGSLALEGVPMPEVNRDVWLSQLPFFETTMLKYREGVFRILFARNTKNYTVDLNIRRDKVWKSSQTRSFAVKSYAIVRSEGKGELTKQYMIIQKEMKEQY
jgi:hypothetical protein